MKDYTDEGLLASQIMMEFLLEKGWAVLLREKTMYEIKDMRERMVAQMLNRGFDPNAGHSVELHSHLSQLAAKRLVDFFEHVQRHVDRGGQNRGN